MRSIKIVTAILSILITQPIWIYLMYKILEAVNASALMWFLFWVYVPVLVVALTLKIIIDDNAK